MIGDTHFLAQARRGLENLKEATAFDSKGDRSNKRLIYLLDNFEVCISSFHYSWCFTTQIRGGLANLLSTKWKLPNYIYIVFSNDQVQEADTLGDDIYKVLDKLFTFVNRSITERRLQLPKKARRYLPPKVIAVKTVARSTDKLNDNNFKIRRRSLNRAIQKSASDFKWRAINIDSILPTDNNNFDSNGEDLSEVGVKLFWKFLSDDLRSYDAQCLSPKKRN